MASSLDSTLPAQVAGLAGRSLDVWGEAVCVSETCSRGAPCNAGHDAMELLLLLGFSAYHTKIALWQRA